MLQLNDGTNVIRVDLAACAVDHANGRSAHDRQFKRHYNDLIEGAAELWCDADDRPYVRVDDVLARVPSFAAASAQTFIEQYGRGLDHHPAEALIKAKGPGAVGPAPVTI